MIDFFDIKFEHISKSISNYFEFFKTNFKLFEINFTFSQNNRIFKSILIDVDFFDLKFEPFSKSILKFQIKVLFYTQ